MPGSSLWQPRSRRAHGSAGGKHEVARLASAAVRRQRPAGSRGRVTSCVRKVRQKAGRRWSWRWRVCVVAVAAKDGPSGSIERPREALPLSPSKPRAVEISASPTPDRLTPCTLDASQQAAPGSRGPRVPADIRNGRGERAGRQACSPARRALRARSRHDRRRQGLARMSVHRGHDRARRAPDPRSALVGGGRSASRPRAVRSGLELGGEIDEAGDLIVGDRDDLHVVGHLEVAPEAVRDVADRKARAAAAPGRWRTGR